MDKIESIIIEQLFKAKDTLLGLFNNRLFGVYIIQGERFVFVNQCCAEMFGYTQDELCSGMGPMDLVVPDAQHLVRQQIDLRLRGEIESSRYSFRVRRKDGCEIEVEVFGATTQFAEQPAIIGIAHNVSERIVAQRAAGGQLNFIEKLLETIPSPVFYKDKEGRFLGCNSAFEHGIGVAHDNLIGRTVYDFLPKERADLYFAADKELLENPSIQTYERTVIYADGTPHNMLLYKAAFNNADGSVDGLVGIMFDISARKQLPENICHDAHYDTLTRLPNQRFFQNSLSEALIRAPQNNHKLAVLSIDFDGFKKVNDTFGRDLGDQLLIQAGQRIRGVLHAYDIVARQGGDQFLVLLSEISDNEMAEHVAHNIINSLAEPYYFNRQTISVSACIGIAVYPAGATEMDLLIRYARQAMSAAKSLGRGCYLLLNAGKCSLSV